jgi:hypothetical protein
MRDKVNELWMALTAYQPKANAGGHGESWALMCSEKTANATYAAARAASHVAVDAADVAADAMWAVDATDNAIYYFTKAEGKKK